MFVGVQLELKQLCRQGFPTQHRAEIWKRFVYAKVADVRADKGDHYYRHLVMRSHDSPVRRVLSSLPWDSRRHRMNDVAVKSNSSRKKETNRLVTSPSGGVRSITMCMSVCLSAHILQQELIRRWDSERTC